MKACSSSDPRQIRHQALVDKRRALILDAAKSAFIELGMDKASIREIARRAGYTAGAIYSYFDGKQALYGALLEESLQRLNAEVMQALEKTTTPQQRLQASARAFFDFYNRHPQDLDLGFYLFQGVQPRGLTPQLNQTLNAQLKQALQPVQEALISLGLNTDAALAETTALFAHIVGLLLLGHSGRIRMFGQTPNALFEDYVEALTKRTLAGMGSQKEW